MNRNGPDVVMVGLGCEEERYFRPRSAFHKCWAGEQGEEKMMGRKRRSIGLGCGAARRRAKLMIGLG